MPYEVNMGCYWSVVSRAATALTNPKRIFQVTSVATAIFGFHYLDAKKDLLYQVRQEFLSGHFYLHLNWNLDPNQDKKIG